MSSERRRWLCLAQDFLLCWMQWPSTGTTARTCTDGFFSVFPMERDPLFFREFCREKRKMSPTAKAWHPAADGQSNQDFQPGDTTARALLTAPVAWEGAKALVG